MTSRLAGLGRTILVGGFLAGCEGRSSAGVSGDEFVLHDSAGVVIAETDGSHARTLLEWEVSPEPTVEIGSAAGDAAYLLSRVRGAGKLSNGNLFIVDGGSRQVRFYDASGDYLFHVGREGNGPGEFGGAPTLVPQVRYDSVMVYDGGLRRFSSFSLEGDLSRSYPSLMLVRIASEIPGGQVELGGIAAPVGILPEGVITRHTTAQFEMISEGVQSPEYTQYRVTNAETGAANVVTVVEDVQYFITPPDATGTMGRLPLPLSIAPMAAAANDRLYLNASRGSEILELALSGELLRIIRLREPEHRATEDDRMQFAEAHLSQMMEGDTRDIAIATYREMPLPDRMPVFQSLVVDDQGWIWGKAYHPGLSESPEWLVFDDEGRGHGKIQLPRNIQVLQIGSDFILGLWRDDLQVEHVQLYELVRN